jgi:receptor protein-tyrosine kinase
MGRVTEALRRAQARSTVADAGARRAAEAARAAASQSPSTAPPDAGRIGTSPAREHKNEGRADAAPPAAVRFYVDRARVARPAGERAGRFVTSPDCAPVVREQYNRLAAPLRQAQAERGLKAVMLTSAIPEEGKTLTAVNLALTLSESHGCRVLLVDADLRQPSIHGAFRLPCSPGLGDLLVSTEPVPLTLVGSGLYVLTAGNARTAPMKTLTSDRMRKLVDDARKAFDWVLLDTPPVGLLSDAEMLASMADGTLLVAKAVTTAYTLVQQAVQVIGPTRLLGVVLNCAPDAPLPDSYYDYYDRH